MQKAFYTDDLMEFKINHKWQNGNLKDIILDQNKYILCLGKAEEKFELQNQILLINNFRTSSIIKNYDQEYSPNERVEFFDESTSSWMEGTVKTKNNNFYLITYTTITSLNNSKILYKDNIRPLNNDNELLKLNLKHAKCFSLKNFETLSNPMKYAKKFIKKLINILNEKINFVFLNKNFDLFIFSIENENENNNLINKDVIDGLIDVAINHFKEVDKSNKKLFK